MRTHCASYFLSNGPGGASQAVFCVCWLSIPSSCNSILLSIYFGAAWASRCVLYPYCLLNISTFLAFFTSFGIWFQLSTTLLETKFPLTSLWASLLDLCMNSLSSSKGIVFSEACLCRSNSGEGTSGGLFAEQISEIKVLWRILFSYQGM
jgi:hypothetical protein